MLESVYNGHKMVLHFNIKILKLQLSIFKRLSFGQVTKESDYSKVKVGNQ